MLHWIRRTVSVLALIWVVPGVEGYYEYQARIPNGDRVPHPCNANFLWKGVGHFNVQGGGARNQFGLDFVAAGHTWTRDLCRKDSDSDGKTNGEELGDPECTWTPGQDPQFNTGITHPGVCDPFGSGACSSRAVPRSTAVSYQTVGDWMAEACDAAEFVCPAKDEDDVESVDFRLPVMPVPAKETTYTCMMFEWPDVTQNFHVIATEPILNNSYIMHHILLFGCPDEMPMKESTWECGMVQCTDLVSSWGVGMLGQCFHQNAGILVGKTGYTKFLLQYHWDNPQHHAHFTDSSGLTLYYTRRLRPYNMAMLMIGQNFIHIPPRSPDTWVTSDCTPACTRSLMTGDIHVTGAINHMHYLGKAMNIELHRCGRFLMNITNELAYSYDSPSHYQFTDTVTVKPGDMIRTNCHFSSLTKATSTFYGFATSDEMCYGFFSFYPKENMPTSHFCTSWKGYLECDEDSDGGCSEQRRKVFSSPTFNDTPIFKTITSSCHFGVCSEECKTALRIARKCDLCLSNEVSREIIRAFHLPSSHHGWRFAACLAVCEAELDRERATDPDLSASIVCREDGTPNHTSATTAKPAYADSCNAEHNPWLAKSLASASRSSGWGVGVSVGLASGTLYLMLLSRRVCVLH